MKRLCLLAVVCLLLCGGGTADTTIQTAGSGLITNLAVFVSGVAPVSTNVFEILSGHYITNVGNTSLNYTNLIVRSGGHLVITNAATLTVSTNVLLEAADSIIFGTNAWSLTINGKAYNYLNFSGNPLYNVNLTKTASTNVLVTNQVAVCTNLVIGTMGGTVTTVGDGTWNVTSNVTHYLTRNWTDSERGSVINMIGAGTLTGDQGASSYTRGTTLTNVINTTGSYKLSAFNTFGTNILISGTILPGIGTVAFSYGAAFYGPWLFYNLTSYGPGSNLFDTALSVSNTLDLGDSARTIVAPAGSVIGNLNTGSTRIEMPADITVTGVWTVAASVTTVYTNAVNVTCGELRLLQGSTLNKTVGTKITVTNRLNITGTIAAPATIRSSATASGFTLEYTGDYSNRCVTSAIISNVNFVGRPPTLYTYWGHAAGAGSTNVQAATNVRTYGFSN